jgi:hypothetical protein
LIARLRELEAENAKLKRMYADLPAAQTDFEAGAGLGIFTVHEPPNTIVRPCTRAVAGYSS